METTPDDLNALIDRYFAIWNEDDAERRRELIAHTWSETASYLDPLMQGAGHAGIDTLVEQVHAQFPGHRFRRTSPIDAHHDRLRFAWDFAPEDGPTVASGTDFGLIAADGRLDSITGFFNHASAAGA